MPALRLEKALRKLCAFQPSSEEVDRRLSAAEGYARDQECERLITLSARFATVLADVGAYPELLRRGMRLSALTSPGTPLARSRQAALHVLARTPKHRGTISGLEKHFARIGTPATAFLFFPLEIDFALTRTTRFLKSQCPAKERAVVQRLRRELWKLAVQEKKEHLWGSHILLLCADAYSERFADPDRYRRLRLCLRDIHPVAKAVQEAAEDIALAILELHSSPAHARHSPDFRSVHWFGTSYSFTQLQADCVRVLWEAWENGTPDVGHRTVLTEAESDTERLIDVFKSHVFGSHPAWGTMIVRGATKGSYRLQEPTPKN